MTVSRTPDPILNLQSADAPVSAPKTDDDLTDRQQQYGEGYNQVNGCGPYGCVSEGGGAPDTQNNHQGGSSGGSDASCDRWGNRIVGFGYVGQGFIQQGGSSSCRPLGCRAQGIGSAGCGPGGCVAALGDPHVGCLVVLVKH